MPVDIDRTLKVLLTIILAAVIGYFAWQVVQRVLYPLELFLLAAIVAFILSPPVDRLHEHGFPRPLAILTVYVCLVLALSALGYFLINPLLYQITKLTNDVPTQLKQLQPRLRNLDLFLKQYNLPSTDKLQGQVTNYAQNLSQTLLQNLGALVYASFNFVVDTVLVLVIAFYLLLDGDQLKERLYGLVPDNQLSRVTFVETTVNEVLGGYLRGQLLVAITIGTMAGIVTSILGVNYPVVVGVLAGILELVPMLGPWLASMPAIVIALFSPDPVYLAIKVAISFLVIQQIESNVIGPRITGHAVGLHPLAALMALLVGIELDGILGALFAVPVAGILYVLSMAIYYDISGRQRPRPQRKAATTSLLGSLSGRVVWRSGNAEQRETSRLPFSNIRRTGVRTGNVFSKRLADMEQKRDVLLRDKLQQRADADRHAVPEPRPSVEGVDIQAGEPVATGQREYGTEAPEPEELPVRAR